MMGETIALSSKYPDLERLLNTFIGFSESHSKITWMEKPVPCGMYSFGEAGYRGKMLDDTCHKEVNRIVAIARTF